MKTLVLKWVNDGIPNYYDRDINKIVAACRSQGYSIDKYNAYRAWCCFSEDHYCAGWLMMPTGRGAYKKIFDCIKEYLQEK